MSSIVDKAERKEFLIYGYVSNCEILLKPSNRVKLVPLLNVLLSSPLGNCKDTKQCTTIQSPNSYSVTANILINFAMHVTFYLY